jgi:hypothetical protein
VNKTFVTKAIYSLITVLAVLLGMSDHPPVAWRGAVLVFGTILAVALVEVYAESIDAILAWRRRLTSVELHKIWQEASPVLVGAQAPTLVLVLSALGFFPVERAIVIAELMIGLLLFSYGIRVGQLFHQDWIRQLMSALVLVAIAGLIVVIKVLFH